MIWWTTAKERNEIETLPDDMPAYIVRQYNEARQENISGRLYLDPSLGEKVVTLTGSTDSPGPRLALVRSGIVIDLDHCKFVFALPGFVTDTDLDILNRSAQPAGYEVRA